MEEETKNEREGSKVEEEIEMPPADSDEDLKNKLVLLDEKVKGNKEPLAVFPLRILSPSKEDKNSKVISFDKQVCTLFITKLITKIL